MSQNEKHAVYTIRILDITAIMNYI